jgi:hypothetical protein
MAGRIVSLIVVGLVCGGENVDDYAVNLVVGGA